MLFFSILLISFSNLGGRYDRLLGSFRITNRRGLFHAVNLTFKFDNLFEYCRVHNTKEVEQFINTLTNKVGLKDSALVLSPSNVREVLLDRMQVATLLWNAAIPCDLLYDERINEIDIKQHCVSHGVKWAINIVQQNGETVKLRNVQSQKLQFEKIYEVRKQDLVDYLKNPHKKELELGTHGHHVHFMTSAYGAPVNEDVLFSHSMNVESIYNQVQVLTLRQGVKRNAERQLELIREKAKDILSDSFKNSPYVQLLVTSLTYKEIQEVCLLAHKREKAKERHRDLEQDLRTLQLKKADLAREVLRLVGVLKQIKCVCVYSIVDDKSELLFLEYHM